MTQVYYDFCIKRAKFIGKFNLLKQINRLTDNGMSLSKAIAYIGEELQEEHSTLKQMERYYEG